MLQKRLALCVLAMIVGAGAFTVISLGRRAEAVPPGWILGTVDGLQYDVLLPQHYNAAERYPTVLYLHQYLMGNYRSGLLRQVQVWFGNPEFRARHPAIVIVPRVDQASDRGANFGGKRAGHSWEGAVLSALSNVRMRYAVDPSRIYVTGNSMGAMGAWNALIDYNVQTGAKGHIFAAGLVLAGTHQTADAVEAARVLRNVPIWAIHGAQDPEVPLEWDRSMARLLSSSPSFRYTEDPELKHNVWDRYYTRSDVWDWLFAQRAAPG